MFEFTDPFDADGEWLRGNLHTHTTASDGVRSPQAVVDHYAAEGYDFLSITDHGRLTDPSRLDPRDMTLIPGQEISLGRTEAGTTFHIVAIGTHTRLRHRDFDLEGDPQRAIDDAKKQGAVAILAHPYWSGLNKNDMLRLTGYDGVEIYNSNCEIYNGAGDSRPHADSILADGRRALLFATDDHHGTPEPMKLPDSAISWISVKAKRNPASILASIKAGKFYASNGPELKRITFEEGTIVAKTSPAASIGFISAPSRGTKYWADDKPLTEAVYTPRKKETYIRVEATDENSRTVWSNPIYISYTLV
ncbi:MAG: CehA/McbA family metallohydrolase [Candidatus Bathyarchaeota archaeon]|nr:CehA/McbA family metallohydrolase [Candidatus Bathyarchaeota archaeon]